MSLLLPCPLCGGEHVKAHYIRDGQSLGCSDCSASVHAFNPNAGDKCIEKWNRRASPWQPIETAPRDDTQILAATADGRVVVWSGYILYRTRNGPSPVPAHLQFPATHWMSLPASPESAPNPTTEGHSS